MSPHIDEFLVSRFATFQGSFQHKDDDRTGSGGGWLMMPFFGLNIARYDLFKSNEIQGYPSMNHEPMGTSCFVDIRFSNLSQLLVVSALATFSNRFYFWTILDLFLVSRNVQNPPAKDGRRIFLGTNAKKRIPKKNVNQPCCMAGCYVMNRPQFSLTPMFETLFGGFSHWKNHAKN